MKIVFTDFDGVLNSQEFQQRWTDANPTKRGHLFTQLGPVAVGRLNEIIDATGALVVVSSTWRILHSRTELCDFLSCAGLSRESAWNDTKTQYQRYSHRVR